MALGMMAGWFLMMGIDLFFIWRKKAKAKKEAARMEDDNIYVAQEGFSLGPASADTWADIIAAQPSWM